MSVLTHVSASQIKDFKACNRLWYYTRILKQRAPQTEAQSRGTTVHGALEAHLKAGAIEPEILERAEKLGISQKDLNDYITAMAPFVGKPGEGLTEFKDSMPTFDGGPQYVLVVDHAREITIENSNGLPWEIIPQIDDLKTTSDFRYCKTPDELGHDVQMVSYAKWALWRLFELKKKPPPTFVSLRHVYVRTRGKRVATARDVLVTPADVESRWQEILTYVRDMVALAAMTTWSEADGEAPLNPQDVPATTTDHCSAYGGCFFRGQCFGAVYDTSRPFIGLFNKEKKEIVAMADNVLTPNFPANGASSARMSLKDRVAMRKGGAAPEASTAPDAAPAAASTPVGPPATPSPAAAAPAATAGVTCGASNTLFPGCACTLVPHEGEHESRGPTGGAIHWSQDGANFGVGVSPNWKPLTTLTSVPLGAPGAAAPNTAAAVVASFSPSATVTDVLPPDAPSRTSTPEEVAAAGASKRKPRTPKAETAAAPAAAAAAPAAAPAATPASAVATQAVAAPAAAAGVCPLKELYIDCWPTKGVSVMPSIGEDILQELAADAAKAANSPDWRLVEYGKGKGAMAVILRERLALVPEILVVSSSTPGSDVLIEVLSPHAKRVVRALRG
jgi:hypothetical protein